MKRILMQVLSNNLSMLEILYKLYYGLLRYKYLSNRTLAPAKEKLFYLLNKIFCSSNDLHRILAKKNMKFYEQKGEIFPVFVLGELKILPPYSLSNISDKDCFFSGMGRLLVESFFYTGTIFPDYIKPREGDVCLDVGANLGTISIIMSNLVGAGGKILGIEPIYYKVAEYNLRHNTTANNWKVMSYAITDKSEEFIEIEESEFLLDSSICNRDYTKGYYNKKYSVETISLDDLVRQEGLERVDFIKIDIEGAEEWALKGADWTLSHFKPRLSISSYHIDFDNEKQHYKLITLLKRYDYTIKHNPYNHIWAY